MDKQDLENAIAYGVVRALDAYYSAKDGDSAFDRVRDTATDNESAYDGQAHVVEMNKRVNELLSERDAALGKVNGLERGIATLKQQFEVMKMAYRAAAVRADRAESLAASMERELTELRNGAQPTARFPVTQPGAGATADQIWATFIGKVFVDRNRAQWRVNETGDGLLLVRRATCVYVYNDFYRSFHANGALYTLSVPIRDVQREFGPLMKAVDK